MDTDELIEEIKRSIAAGEITEDEVREVIAKEKAGRSSINAKEYLATLISVLDESKGKTLNPEGPSSICQTIIALELDRIADALEKQNEDNRGWKHYQREGENEADCVYRLLNELAK